jgi:signal transduction histidine kinase/DNA-binding response OmpR family regulator
MGLRLKTAAAVTTIFSLLLAGIYTIFSTVILGEFSAVEERQASTNLSRLVEGIQGIHEELETRAREWSHRAANLLRSEGGNPARLAERFREAPFDFRDALLLNREGAVLFAGRLNPDTLTLEPISASQQEEILQGVKAQETLRDTATRSMSGLVYLNGAPAFVAVATGSPDNTTAPQMALVLTRNFSLGAQWKLAKQLRMNPHFKTLDAKPSAITDTIEQSDSLKTTETHITAAHVLSDLTGTPLMRVSVDIPRQVYAQGVAAMNHIVLLVAISLVLANAILLLFLNSSVITPLRGLCQLIMQVAKTGDFSLRVPLTRSDEIGSLGRSLTTLLEGTERSYKDMITARNEAEKANSGKSLFIAKVSHELRTPIHGITGMLRILMKQETNVGKRSYIQMAQDSANGLLETINEILDFSKMETGSLTLENLEFNLHDVIRATVTQQIPRFEQKPDVELSWDIGPDVPEKVTGDPLRLRNVLTNLLGNAFKFTSSGSVSLVVSNSGYIRPDIAAIRFEVRDTGIGIPADRIADIFKPFTQADESTARLYAGTGLGLAIVKQIVDQMGGTVSAESLLNKGSVFTVEAPCTIVREKNKRSEQRRTVPQSVAILAESTQGVEVLQQGFAHFGVKFRLFDTEQPQAVTAILDAIDSFDLIHISGTNDLLVDELTPLLKMAARRKIPVVMAVRPSEMAMTDSFGRFDTFYVTHKPVSALDVMLIAAGKLTPSTTLPVESDEQERSDHQLKILIADDAATNRIILKNLLEEAGHSVEVVENGQQLLERIIQSTSDREHGRKSLDVVLTDIQMPVMDGLTAAQHVRELEKEHHSSRKLPIVAVTAYAFPEECSKMRASGIDHIITKPISPKSLSRLLSQITCEVVTEQQQSQETESDLEVVQELCRVAEDFARHVDSLTTAVESHGDESSGPALDIPGVYERSGNSLRRTGLIFSGFLSSYREPTEAIRATAIPPIDPGTYRRHVHSLKGLLLDVGANETATFAGRIERQAVDEPHNLLEQERDALVRQVEGIAALLNELVTALPSLEVFAALPSLDDQMALN